MTQNSPIINRLLVTPALLLCTCWMLRLFHLQDPVFNPCAPPKMTSPTLLPPVWCILAFSYGKICWGSSSERSSSPLTPLLDGLGLSVAHLG